MTTSRTIEIWTSPSQDDTRHALPSISKPKVEVSKIEINTLSNNLHSFLEELQSTLLAPPSNETDFFIDKVELNLGISASGGFAIIGKMDAGVQASIKVTLQRRSIEK